MFENGFCRNLKEPDGQGILGPSRTTSELNIKQISKMTVLKSEKSPFKVNFLSGIP